MKKRQKTTLCRRRSGSRVLTHSNALAISAPLYVGTHCDCLLIYSKASIGEILSGFFLFGRLPPRKQVVTRITRIYSGAGVNGKETVPEPVSARQVRSTQVLFAIEKSPLRPPTSPPQGLKKNTIRPLAYFFRRVRPSVMHTPKK